MSIRNIVVAFVAVALLTCFAAWGATAGGVCVWSCQQNPSGSWSYWFARSLSDCAVTDCLPRGGSSPSGTPCDPGDPDIPGDCRTKQADGAFLPPPVLICPLVQK